MSSRNKLEVGVFPWCYPTTRTYVREKNTKHETEIRRAAKKNGLKTVWYDGRLFYKCPVCGEPCEKIRAARHHCETEE